MKKGLTTVVFHSVYRTKLYQGKCYGNCPPKTFTSDRTCTDCPAHALTCTATKVLTCEEDYFPLGNTCEHYSYWRIPGVASSAAYNFQDSTTAQTESQCVDYCSNTECRLF
jgi:hypothetical protein